MPASHLLLFLVFFLALLRLLWLLPLRIRAPKKVGRMIIPYQPRQGLPLMELLAAMMGFAKSTILGAGATLIKTTGDQTYNSSVALNAATTTFYIGGSNSNFNTSLNSFGWYVCVTGRQRRTSLKPAAVASSLR